MMLKITRQPNQQIWFTSDYHEKHLNLCRGTSKWTDKTGCRDFDTLEQMSEAVVSGHNKLVKSNDIVFNLGDIIFGDKTKLPEFLGKLSCKNIYLIYGNHDRWMFKNSDAKSLFLGCFNKLELSINGKLFVLDHYCNKVWFESGNGSIHLYAHSHGSLPDDANALSIDVGVDTKLFQHEKYTPYSLDEILRIMNNCKTFRPVDHHK